MTSHSDAQGPWVVEVRRPCDHCEGGGEVWGEDAAGQPDDPEQKSTCCRCRGSGEVVVSREAFEDLAGVSELARCIVLTPMLVCFNTLGYLDAQEQLDAVLRSGSGEIGPGPSGETITVEQTTWIHLLLAGIGPISGPPPSTDVERANVLAAANAIWALDASTVRASAQEDR